MELQLTKEMTFNELKHFFSATKEFNVSLATDKEGNTIADTYELNCEGKGLLIYKPTIQTLIRAIAQLSGLIR